MAYNKDMQEDKEGVFDACDTVSMCLPVMTGMIETMTAKPEAMKKAAQRGFINATDLADYLVRKGLPFRSAYKISGAIVGDCVKSGAVLEELPLETYQQYSDLFDSDVYEAIDLTACVEKRTSAGGPAKVQEQIDYVHSVSCEGRLLTMKKMIALLLAALMICAMFTGCGEKGTDAQERPEAPGSSPSRPAPTSRPFESLGDNNEVVGIEIDVLQTIIARQLGVDARDQPDGLRFCPSRRTGRQV